MSPLAQQHALKKSMPANLDRYRADLKDLITIGDQMLLDLCLESKKEKGKLDKEEIAQAKQVQGTFWREYQRWYTEASAVIRQLIPDRLAEFEHLYKGDGKRKEIVLTTFTIQDWTNGVRASPNTYTGEKSFDDCAAVSMRFQNQVSILKASERRFESSLLDMRQLVSADLLDSELEAARELLKHGFRRAAGSVAGVVLEKHLGHIAENHKVTVKKKIRPSASLMIYSKLRTYSIFQPGARFNDSATSVTCVLTTKPRNQRAMRSRS